MLVVLGEYGSSMVLLACAFCMDELVCWWVWWQSSLCMCTIPRFYEMSFLFLLSLSTMSSNWQN